MSNEQATDAQITFKLSPDDKQWHERQAISAGLRMSDYLRNLLLERRLAVELAPPEPEPVELTPQEAYLQEVRTTGGPITAAQRLGITSETLTQWAQDPEFPKRVTLAKAAWLESLEQDMVLIGKGRTKGDTQALGWILNAHHWAHGRAKKELLLGILNPLLRKLTEFIKAEFGPESHERLKKAMENFQIEVRKKMVGMS